MSDDDEIFDPGHNLLWIERTWIDVRPGDRVRMKGVEAVVDAAMHLEWRVLAGDEGWWSDQRVDHSYVHTRLMGREKLFLFKPDVPVEIQLTQHEIDALDAMGWENRVIVITQRLKELLT